MARVRDWLTRHPYVISVVLIAAVTGYLFHLNNETRKKALTETCHFVDAEHNKARAAIVQGEVDLYGKFRNVQLFKAFTDTPEHQAATHKLSMERYADVRKTRPSYCDDLASNPVPPYPSLARIKALAAHTKATPF